MSHNLDITNGVASYVDSRGDAWHRLGQDASGAMTAQQALELGYLADWNLRKSGLYSPVTIGEGTDDPVTIDVQIHNKHAIIRDNPVTGFPESLGVVGDAYTIVHNEQLTDLLDTVVDQSGAHYETAGAIDGGRKVFVTMKMPEGAQIGGVDQVDNYIAAMTSHDGSTSTIFMVTPVRIVCQNTLNFALQNHQSIFRVRHTVGAHNILAQQVREALDFTYAYLDEFHDQAEMLVNTTMTQMQFEAIIHEEFAAYEDQPASVITRAQNKIDEMSRLFSDSETHADVRDTAWAGLNALTEWYDHYSPVRDTNGMDDIARSRKALMDPGFKTKALELMLSAS